MHLFVNVTMASVAGLHRGAAVIYNELIPLRAQCCKRLGKASRAGQKRRHWQPLSCSSSQPQAGDCRAARRPDAARLEDKKFAGSLKKSLPSLGP